MAEDQIAFIVTQMHAVALTVAEPSAFAALVLLHPRAVAIWLKTVFPYFYEIILVDIALMIIRAYASASGYGTVYQN